MTIKYLDAVGDEREISGIVKLTRYKDYEFTYTATRYDGAFTFIEVSKILEISRD